MIKFRNVGDAIRNDGCPVFPGGADGICRCRALDFVWTRETQRCSLGRDVQTAFFPGGHAESVVFKCFCHVILDHLVVCDDGVESSDGVTGYALYVFHAVEGVFERRGYRKLVSFLYAVAEVGIAPVDVRDKEEWGDDDRDEQEREQVADDSRESVERIFDENGNFMELLDDFGEFFRIFLEVVGESFLGGFCVTADSLACLGVCSAGGAFLGKPQNFDFLSFFDVFYE